MEKIFVGVLRLAVLLPGARSLKDRRQLTRALSDRVRHRFSVTCNEILGDSRPDQQVLVVTTAGNDAALIRRTLDQVTQLARSNPRLVLSGVDVDVFRWHPHTHGLADFFGEEEQDE